MRGVVGAARGGEEESQSRQIGAPSMQIVHARNAIAVIGITGPDDPARRAYMRQAWDTSQPHGIMLRFAVSRRDGMPFPTDDLDVHRLDCLGQSSGLAVVEISLSDAWYRFAISEYPKVPFIGRADTDVVVAPAWLDLVLQRLLVASGNESYYYIGRVAWTSWHERDHRPVGFGYSPRIAAKAAYWGEGACPAQVGTCSSHYAFVRGPFILLSSALMRWYARSKIVGGALSAAIDSRLDRSVATSTSLPASLPFTLEQARRRPMVFLQPPHAGDFSVRLAEDSFLGWALCKDGPSNVTVLQIPNHAFVDAPGPCNKQFSPRKSPSLATCCLTHLNATRATMIHELKTSPWLMPAIAAQVTANAPKTAPIRCGMMRARVSGGPQLKCGSQWGWCTLQRGPGAWLNREAPAGSLCVKEHSREH